MIKNEIKLSKGGNTLPETTVQSTSIFHGNMRRVIWTSAALWLVQMGWFHQIII
nr:hypothetical protein [Peribacillus frigoritolerans]